MTVGLSESKKAIIAADALYHGKARSAAKHGVSLAIVSRCVNRVSSDEMFASSVRRLMASVETHWSAEIGTTIKYILREIDVRLPLMQDAEDRANVQTLIQAIDTVAQLDIGRAALLGDDEEASANNELAISL